MHKTEQTVSAISMIPGILLSMHWIKQTSNPIIIAIAYAYIMACVGSFAYHMYCAANPGYNPAWLRLDITCQQLVIYMGACLTGGYSGAFLMAPFASLIALADFRDIPSSYLALATHAISILVVSATTNMRLVLQWAAAFFVYSLKEIIPNSYMYSQTLWHIMCHYNIATSWASYELSQNSL